MTTPIDTASEQPPEWLHLMPAGTGRTKDGRGPYILKDAEAVIRRSMAEGKLVLDENHSTDLAGPKGLPAPARGWIVALQAREDGLWGQVVWNADAILSSVWKQYRGVSPVIAHKEDGTITTILRASLTNTPNFHGLQSLHSMESTMSLRSDLLDILDLPDDASDSAIALEVKAMKRISLHSRRETVSLNSATEMAHKARQYQAEREASGVTIDFMTAVRAVFAGV